MAKLDISDILAPSFAMREGDNMTTTERESVGRDFVSMEPTDDELFSSFIFYLTKHASEEKVQNGFPEDRTAFMNGLRAAAGKAPFLARFLGNGSEEITPADELLNQLEAGKTLVLSDGLIVIDDSKRNHIASVARSFFKEQGIAVLKEAAEAAKQVWSGESV